ncbi:hypothetical protein [Capnocytophaga catalasegens]|uniref:Uncharacterized protein n=1 Tax=Capnocytophaga catalasegens TaxID=1004260 RepID=A0AAV5ASL7_9FLAO|nr:hypothetical protein [Capnocytophaga catalasegens]GIZ14867.1 hypothetical protein RCZ03_08670 [Capnocytophaga catalasegens]GJM49245.1 hypothetical protein RCZ15_02200 [Capnocytophaga catalasegens]GJM52395.1 hypothetical protein RCZ16_07120 [Capnocytophaga catalasegens]
MHFLRFFLIGIISISNIGCDISTKKTTQNELLFPEQSHTILQINRKNQFLNAIGNSSFWKTLYADLPDTNVQNLLRSLPSDTNIWLAYTDKATYCISGQDTLIDSTSIWKNASSGKIDSLVLKNQKWFYTQKHNKLIISSLSSISDFSKQEKSQEMEQIYKLQKTIDTQLPANLFLNKSQNERFFSEIFPSKTLQYFQNWVAWDILVEKNKIRISGTGLSQKDSVNIASLSKTLSSDLQSINFIPSEVNNVRSYTFADATNLKLKYEIATDFPKYINEVSFFTLAKDTLVAITSSDAEETLRQLLVSKEENYHEQRILTLEENPDLNLFLANFDSQISLQYVFLYQSTLIFAQKETILHTIINQLQANVTLANNPYYRALQEQSSSKANYTEIENLQKNTTFSQKYGRIADKYHFACLQISPQSDFFVCTFTSIQSENKINSDNINEKYQVTLDADAQTLPKWVLNHRTKNREIVIQDIDNQLYLINNEGKTLWKKKLDSPIKSTIFQVDLFKNGNLQMAFSTHNSLWVIDRNGQNVSPFPVTYKETILPLEVFDYEQNMDYRFVIACENKIRILDKNGKIVSGFEKTSTPNTITQTPKHFRLGGKDYIVFPEKDGKLNILHRNGKDRIIIKDKFDFSENPIFLKEDWFCFTTKHGKQVFIDQSGGLRINDRQLSEHHTLSYRHQTEAIISDNKLIINNKTHELPYGIYTNPSIFRIGRTIYIAITDTQNSKVYLLNSQGEILPNFPIFGISAPEITIDNGRHLFTFLKDKQTIFVYSF